jgi:hypothetical protein
MRAKRSEGGVMANVIKLYEAAASNEKRGAIPDIVFWNPLKAEGKSADTAKPNIFWWCTVGRWLSKILAKWAGSTEWQANKLYGSMLKEYGLQYVPRKTTDGFVEHCQGIKDSTIVVHRSVFGIRRDIASMQADSTDAQWADVKAALDEWREQNVRLNFANLKKNHERKVTETTRRGAVNSTYVHKMPPDESIMDQAISMTDDILDICSLGSKTNPMMVVDIVIKARQESARKSFGANHPTLSLDEFYK